MLAIDVGYSAVKVITDKGESVLFSSHVAPFVDRGIAQIGSQKHIKIGSKTFITGNANLDHDLKTDEELHGSEEWEALMARAFYEVFLLGGSPAGGEVVDMVVECLGVGLPFQQYRDEKIAALQSRKEFSFEVDGTPFVVKVEDVKVFPQGFAMIGNVDDPEELNDAGFLDIGFYTLDVVLTRGGSVVHDKCHSQDLGVHRIYEQLRKSCSSKCGKMAVSDHEIKKVLEQGGFKFKGKWVSFVEERDAFLREHVAEIKNYLQGYWRNQFDFLERLVIGGGGAVLLEPFLKQQSAEEGDGSLRMAGIPCEIVNDPVFGNANGFMRCMQQGV